jgi:hypothetical protein
MVKPNPFGGEKVTLSDGRVVTVFTVQYNDTAFKYIRNKNTTVQNHNGVSLEKITNGFAEKGTDYELRRAHPLEIKQRQTNMLNRPMIINKNTTNYQFHEQNIFGQI